MTAQLVFWSAFNTHAFRRARETEAWTEQRLRFWLAFTLRSILGQRDGDWRYWLVCAGRLRHLTDPLREAITDHRVEMVIDDECCERLAQLPSADRYLLTRVDSDDLYHPVTAPTLLKQRPTTPFLQFNSGFALDVGRAEVLPWRSRSSPFYTHVYGEEIRRLDVWAEPHHTKVARSATTLGSGHFLVSLHQANTSTTRAHASGGALPTGRSAVVAERFGIGGDHRIDELVATARVPVRWGPRRRALERELAPLVDEVNAGDTDAPVSPAAVTLLHLACEMSAARKVAIVDDPAVAAVVRSRGDVPCRLFVSAPACLAAARDRLRPGFAESTDCVVASPEPHAYDVVYVDLRRSGPEMARSAVRAVAVTGMLVIAGVDEDLNGGVLRDVLDGVMADPYPEAAALTRDGSGTTCRLLGRPLIR